MFWPWTRLFPKRTLNEFTKQQLVFAGECQNRCYHSNTSHAVTIQNKFTKTSIYYRLLMFKQSDFLNC